MPLQLPREVEQEAPEIGDAIQSAKGAFAGADLPPGFPLVFVSFLPVKK